MRASHPLLAAAAERARAGERRALHPALAGAVADEELRALHLALATDRPDAELAATVAAAAAGASARGARQEAVELAEHALRLTPAESAERGERLLALAGYLETAGELQRVTELLTPELDSLPPGAARARRSCCCPRAPASAPSPTSSGTSSARWPSAGDDPALRVAGARQDGEHTPPRAVARIRQAEAWALEALPAAPGRGPEVERLALFALGWTRACAAGRSTTWSSGSAASSDAASYIADSPERVAAQRLVWRGDMEPGARRPSAPVARRRARRAGVLRPAAAAPVRARAARRRLGRRRRACSTSGRSPRTASC